MTKSEKLKASSPFDRDRFNTDYMICGFNAKKRKMIRAVVTVFQLSTAKYVCTTEYSGRDMTLVHG